MKNKISLSVCAIFLFNLIVFMFDNSVSVSAAYASYNWSAATKSLIHGTVAQRLLPLLMTL